jgi:hypothetical protein
MVPIPAPVNAPTIAMIEIESQISFVPSIGRLKRLMDRR